MSIIPQNIKTKQNKITTEINYNVFHMKISSNSNTFINI